MTLQTLKSANMTAEIPRLLRQIGDTVIPFMGLLSSEYEQADEQKKEELEELMGKCTAVIVKFSTEDTPEGWNEELVQTQKEVSATICKIASCESGAILLRNIYSVRNGLTEGIQMSHPPVVTMELTPGNHHPKAATKAPQASMCEAKVEGGIIKSGGNFFDCAVNPGRMEYARLVAESVGNATAKTAGRSFKNIGASLLGHEMIHAIHDIYGASLFGLQGYEDNPLKSMYDKTNSSSNETFEKDEIPRGAEEHVTSGLIPHPEHYVHNPGEIRASMYVDRKVYDSVDSSIRPAFMVSERMLREELGVFPGFGYIKKQSIEQVKAGIMTIDEYMRFHLVDRFLVGMNLIIKGGIEEKKVDSESALYKVLSKNMNSWLRDFGGALVSSFLSANKDYVDSCRVEGTNIEKKNIRNT